MIIFLKEKHKKKRAVQTWTSKILEIGSSAMEK